jgi:hypothetical protein
MILISNLSHELLNLLVIFVLLCFLSFELRLVLFSVLDDPLGYSFNSHLRLELELLVNA